MEKGIVWSLFSVSVLKIWGSDQSLDGEGRWNDGQVSFGSKVFSLYNIKYSLRVLKFSHYFLNIVKNIELSLR